MIALFSSRPGRAAALLSAGLLLIAAPAAARPLSTSMTCAQAAALVQKQGAVVMDTGPNTYDRYVSTLSACWPGQALKPQWVATRDMRQCFVGYTCYDPSIDRGFR